ncbi:hypothetical protein Y032_0969g3247 [Ancylostoma ceylanicum]|uniref:Uncharacterized protein n=1 Tax=Ancylostoma ceylanicum TaxID=53326 RepID=A0A016W9Y9_9BILA|nr:hypothetical protein Y032_0969g3247 [Ancylostoma ceylanicum]
MNLSQRHSAGNTCLSSHMLISIILSQNISNSPTKLEKHQNWSDLLRQLRSAACTVDTFDSTIKKGIFL